MVYLSLLVAFAVVIHTVEAYIPFPIPVPGAKLGLANIITLLALCFYGFYSGLTVAILRSILGSLLAGGFLGYAFFFSLAGALVSTVLMAACLPLVGKGHLSLISVSVIGAVSHNTAQVVTAALIIDNFHLLAVYLPYLILLAVPTGLITGMAVVYLEKKLRGAGLVPGLRGGGA